MKLLESEEYNYELREAYSIYNTRYTTYNRGPIGRTSPIGRERGHHKLWTIPGSVAEMITNLN